MDNQGSQRHAIEIARILESFSVIYCCITKLSKPQWYRTTMSFFFSHRLAIWQGLMGMAHICFMQCGYGSKNGAVTTSHSSWDLSLVYMQFTQSPSSKRENKHYKASYGLVVWDFWAPNPRSLTLYSIGQSITKPSHVQGKGHYSSLLDGSGDL